MAVTKLIASMYNDDGSVAVEGFYDDATPLSPEDRAAIAKIAETVDPDAVATKYGISELLQDDEYSPLERAWMRGSMTVTGLKSGFRDGPGAVLPETAWFNMVCRLGAGQDPDRVAEAIEAHVKAHTPWGIQAEVKTYAKSVAVLIPSDDPSYALSKVVQTAFYGQPPVEAYVGGSVGALSYLKAADAPNLVSLGIQRSDENFHADNEYMRIASFEKGQRLFAMILHALVGQPAGNR